MKKFILRIILFFSLLKLLLLSCLLLPPTPKAEKYLLFAKIHKDYLLKNVESPRIIFVGGSNLSFGINSKTIQKSLGLNPINTGLHAGIGLIYMLDSVLPYVHSGDIIIVAPEYSHFYGGYGYGSEELLRIVMDVSPADLRRLRIRQWINIIPYFPKYSLSKLKPSEYLNVRESTIYGVNSFNEFGDVHTHWQLTKQQFKPYEEISGKFDSSVISKLSDFQIKLIKKGAILFITFPGLQSTSFDNSRTQIMQVETELRRKKFCLIGTPQEYKMPESLMFNTPYHLSKKGMNYRTQLLINDLKNHKIFKNGSNKLEQDLHCK